MKEPFKIEFELGKDIHDRRVTLAIEKNMRGVSEMTITSHASSQRDDTQVIRSLSKENLKALSEIMVDF